MFDIYNATLAAVAVLTENEENSIKWPLDLTDLNSLTDILCKYTYMFMDMTPSRFHSRI